MIDSRRYLDLGVVLALVIGAVASLSLPVPVALRAVIGLPLVLILPGYVVVETLVPRGLRPATGARRDWTVVERLVVAAVVSIVVSPAIALVLASADMELRAGPVGGALAIWTLGWGAIAAYRRRSPFPASGSLVESVRTEAAELPRSAQIILGAVVVSLLATAVATSAIMTTTPREAEIVEFFVLNEEGKAGDYPSRVIADDQFPLIVGLTHTAGQAESYTVRVATADWVTSADGYGAPANRTELDAWAVDMAPESEWRQQFLVRFESAGTKAVILELTGVDDPSPIRNLILFVEVVE